MEQAVSSPPRPREHHRVGRRDVGITDGYENDSHEYDGQSIKKLVETLKGKGWVFTYIGANQDVQAVASAMSITNTLAFSADAEGTRVMFERESKARSRWADRLSLCNDFSAMADDYFAMDDADDKSK